MRKFVGGISLMVALILAQPITAHANSLSYIPNYEDDIPQEVTEICEVVGHEYDICPELLEAIAYQESRFTADVKNHNHVGMFQVNVKVHADRISKYGWTADDMYDPYKGAVVAADYLHELDLQYEDIAVALCCYSGYGKKVSDYKEYGHLPTYVRKVLERSYDYEDLHEKHKF